MKNPFIMRQLEESNASAVKEVALESWLYTYQENCQIFEEHVIRSFVSDHYKIDVLQATVPLIEEGLTDFLVIEDTNINKIIGFGQIGFDEFWEENSPKQNEIRLFRIYLRPDYIGKGLGKQLLERLEQFVKDHGREKYHLYVHEKNELARGFYDKNGFVHNREKDEEDEIYLEKQIA